MYSTNIIDTIYIGGSIIIHHITFEQGCVYLLNETLYLGYINNSIDAKNSKELIVRRCY